MLQVKLYTRTGGYVATVLVPPMTPPPELIAWGTRFFVRDPEGEYREGLVWMADVNPSVVNPTDKADLV